MGKLVNFTAEKHALFHWVIVRDVPDCHFRKTGNRFNPVLKISEKPEPEPVTG